MTKTQTAVVQWLAQHPYAPASAVALASYLGLKELPADEQGPPSDLAGFEACLDLFRDVPRLRRNLPQMAQLSPQWASFVGAWGRLVEAFDAENDLTQIPRLPRGSTSTMISAALAGRLPRGID